MTRPLPFFVDKYECVEHLGGNMAEVYLANDWRAHRPTVLKLLTREQAEDQSVRARFIQEGRLACQCSHPNVIITYAVDEWERQPYIAMEYLRGQCLREKMRAQKNLGAEPVIEIVSQVADALQYLHGLGIVHRDIKPLNIFLCQSGLVKLFDFGIARAANEGLTQPGVAIGTPSYMAPEQLTGRTVDFRTDIYAFGVLLFEMLTGRLPFTAQTLEELAVRITTAEPDFEKLRNAGVGEPTVSLVASCLSKNPHARPPSFVEISKELISLKSKIYSARLLLEPKHSESTISRPESHACSPRRYAQIADTNLGKCQPAHIRMRDGKFISHFYLLRRQQLYGRDLHCGNRCHVRRGSSRRCTILSRREAYLLMTRCPLLLSDARSVASRVFNSATLICTDIRGFTLGRPEEAATPRTRQQVENRKRVACAGSGLHALNKRFVARIGSRRGGVRTGLSMARDSLDKKLRSTIVNLVELLLRPLTFAKVRPTKISSQDHRIMSVRTGS